MRSAKTIPTLSGRCLAFEGALGRHLDFGGTGKHPVTLWHSIRPVGSHNAEARRLRVADDCPWAVGIGFLCLVWITTSYRILITEEKLQIIWRQRMAISNEGFDEQEQQWQGEQVVVTMVASVFPSNLRADVGQQPVTFQDDGVAGLGGFVNSSLPQAGRL